jgi:N-acetylglucosaminyl-diphospho-decaprenol L-rhamnosyltransferase
MTNKLAIGIVLYRNPENQLNQFFKSLDFALEVGLSVGLHVIDNSGQASEDEIKNLINTNLRERISFDFHESQGNIGFAKAHNKLMISAFKLDVDAYLCVNPDGFFHPSAFTSLLHHFELNGSKSLYEMRQLPVEHPKPYNAMTLETEWCSGAALLIPREIFMTTGGFDENIFMYCEDVDLSWRARLAGFTCRVMPDSYFYHDITGRNPSPSRDKELFTAGRYLGWKWKNESFMHFVSNIMVEKGIVNDPRFLPNLESTTQIDASQEKIGRIVEFRRLFHFSEARWNINE